ncbi:MAG: adenosylmethionine decarboxylase [Deltaproteobacteria bacterium]|nr:adenosylmethionine decarboxylase [Deltaproteobacteria bacterium]
MVTTLGRHLIAEFYDCDDGVTDDVAAIGGHLRAAAEVIGATVVGEVFHRYEPQGVSGTLLIAESHMSVHTWPEAGYVAVDIFTCGGLDPRPGFRYLVTALGAQSSRMHEILRGVDADVEQGRRLMPDDVAILARTVPLED